MYLNDWLKIKRISYKEFSEMLQVERTTLYCWLKGIRSPNGKNLQKIQIITENEVTFDEIPNPQIQSKTKKS